jgi:hypothetical protein
MLKASLNIAVPGPIREVGRLLTLRFPPYPIRLPRERGAKGDVPLASNNSYFYSKLRIKNLAEERVAPNY